MKKIFFAVLLLAAANSYAQSGKWTGFISDSNCGAKGKDASHSDCAKKCVKDGADPVLVVGDKVYKFADIKQAMDVVGKKVTITGKLEGDVITIEKVKEEKS